METKGLLYEDYSIENDTLRDPEHSSDEELPDSFDEQTTDDDMCQINEQENMNLGISLHLAEQNYASAGTEVEEEPDQITIADNADLIDLLVDAVLDEQVTECNMKYKPSEMQRVSINALGSLKNLILVSPTGSGKMNVPLLAALVLRKILKKPKGVCIITQPLTSIMKQKMTNDVCSTAVLSMTGELVVSSAGVEDDATLSCKLQDLLSGLYPVLFGHPESFDSKLGQLILRELKKQDDLILVCIDEFHQGGEGHWNVFRPSMMSSSASLR